MEEHDEELVKMFIIASTKVSVYCRVDGTTSGTSEEIHMKFERDKNTQNYVMHEFSANKRKAEENALIIYITRNEINIFFR